MRRRGIRDMLTNNEYELQFSAYNFIELENSQVEERQAESDQLLRIQQDIFEELVMKRDVVHVVQQINRKDLMKKKPSFRNTL